MTRLFSPFISPSHFITHHDKTFESLSVLLQKAADDHPEMTTLAQLLELIHTRQHASIDWDAGHAEDDLSV